MDREFLTDEIVILRPLQLSDLEAGYIHWFDDRVVCAGNNHHRFPYSYEEMEEYIGNSYSRQNLTLAIITKSDNKHVGNISLSNIDFINSNCTFSIVLGEKEAWGRSVGYSSAKLIIEHAFNELNIKRINIGTFECNVGMRKLAVKLGAVEEGIRRKAVFKNGEYIDVIEYGLLSDEYKGGESC